MKLRNKKTGETGYLELEKGDGEKYIGLRVYKNDFMYKGYQSLAELNAEWEDYKPLMPQIENEVVCEIIREWAEVCGVATVEFNKYGDEEEFTARKNGWSVGISFNFPLKLEEGRTYTIPELCGEEE